MTLMMAMQQRRLAQNVRWCRRWYSAKSPGQEEVKSSWAQRAGSFGRSVAAIGLSMGLGDALCQVIEKGSVVDRSRTEMMAVIGTFVTGPISYSWNHFLERQLPGSTPRRILQKTVSNSTFAFIISLPVMFTAVTLLSKDQDGKRTKTMQDAMTKVQTDLVPTFLAGCLYWPVFNLFVFKYVPVDMRALTNSLIGTVWNIYLSLMANKKVDEPERKNVHVEPSELVPGVSQSMVQVS